MRNDPGKVYFDRLSGQLDFNRDPLEKAYRLLELGKEMSSVKELAQKLALKGGTAIQFVFFGLRRLSVDIDLNYIGSVDREEAQRDRLVIREALSRLFAQFGYTFQLNSWHSQEQFELSYVNSGGNKDRIKVEINYSERVPVLQTETLSLKHPFEPIGDVKMRTYAFEESMGMKTRALLTRGTPRDLYDIYLLNNWTGDFDKDLYRKIAIFYLCCAPIDARDLDLKLLEKLDEKSLKRNLAPMLRKREHGLDIIALRTPVVRVMTELLRFDDNEKEFLENFYEQRRFDSKLLFKEHIVNPDLSKHPVILWRLKGT